MENVFHTKHPLIGALHLLPLLGSKEFVSYDIVSAAARADLQAMIRGGVTSVIIENNYDLPHSITVGPETVAMMTRIIADLRKATDLPLGVSVLWNDYRAAFSITKTCDCQYIRIPAYVDDVKTSYGLVTAVAKDVTVYREKIHADDIAILADIQVKHAEMVDRTKPLIQSAKEAIREGADGLIITGKWTGDPPREEMLREVRDAVGKFPLFVGSGATVETLEMMSKYVNGVIVGTALKEGTISTKETNRKSYHQRVDEKKVGVFAAVFQSFFTDK